MGFFKKTFITFGILAIIWLNWSCASIEQSEAKKADNHTKSSKIVLASSSQSETTKFIPQYVFLDNHDNLSLYIQEDTILPKFHIRITKENEKVCNELINYAFLNNIEIELRFNKLNQEVNSLELTRKNEKTKAEKQVRIPIGPINIAQNTKDNNSIKEYISSYKVDKENNVIDIGIDFLTAQLAHYHFPINAFENSIDIIKKAFEKKLLAEFKFNPDTHEIVSIQFCNATEQTKKKLTNKKGHILEPDECSTLTEEELKKVFSVISSYSCNKTVRPRDLPCIPFGYIEDGCFARAHAMRRLLNRMGYDYTTAIDHTTETFGDVFSLTSPNEKTIRDSNYEITDYVCQNVMNPRWQLYYIELVRKNNPQLF